MSTVLSRFNSGPNSLNAIRLALAILVIVSHTWAIGGYGPEPELGGTHLGTWGVLGFFGISGFLITRSRLSGQSAWNFYRARVARIFPAFIVCLVVVAFAFSTLSLAWDRGASWSLLSAVSYVGRNFALFPPHFSQPGIAHTLAVAAYPEMWNGSLWTLFWEAGCYVLIGLAASVLPKRLLRFVVAGAFVVGSLVILAGHLEIVHLPELAARVLSLFVAFAAGSVLFLYGDEFRMDVGSAGISLVLLVFIVLSGSVESLAALPLTFVVLFLSTALPLHGIGSKYDASYGMYIYAWPIQQMLFLAFGHNLPVPMAVIASVAITVPFAYLSCLLIERPAMRSIKRMRNASRASELTPRLR